MGPCCRRISCFYLLCSTAEFSYYYMIQCLISIQALKEFTLISNMIVHMFVLSRYFCQWIYIRWQRFTTGCAEKDDTTTIVSGIKSNCAFCYIVRTLLLISLMVQMGFYYKNQLILTFLQRNYIAKWFHEIFYNSGNLPFF